MMHSKKIACFNCINLTYSKSNKLYQCDFEYWNDKKFEEMVLLLPVFFDCDDYEEQYE